MPSQMSNLVGVKLEPNKDVTVGAAESALTSKYKPYRDYLAEQDPTTNLSKFRSELDDR